MKKIGFKISSLSATNLLIWKWNLFCSRRQKKRSQILRKKLIIFLSLIAAGAAVNAEMQITSVLLKILPRKVFVWNNFYANSETVTDHSKAELLSLLLGGSRRMELNKFPSRKWHFWQNWDVPAFSRTGGAWLILWLMFGNKTFHIYLVL